MPGCPIGLGYANTIRLSEMASHNVAHDCANPNQNSNKSCPGCERDFETHRQWFKLTHYAIPKQ
jgi:hypothetical protein